MSIATQADVETILQVTFDSPTDPRVAAIIDAAQRAVEEHVGCPLDAATGVVTYHTGHGTPGVLLPRWPVTAVTSVTVDGTAMVEGDDFVVWPDAVVQNLRSGWWSAPKGIVVTADYGYTDATEAPRPLRQLVAAKAAQLWQAGIAFTENQGASGVAQETIGGYSVTFAETARNVAGVLQLTPDERRTARRFNRRAAGAVGT